jgi:hypothetical protein
LNGEAFSWKIEVKAEKDWMAKRLLSANFGDEARVDSLNKDLRPRLPVSSQRKDVTLVDLQELIRQFNANKSLDSAASDFAASKVKDIF